ncbi:hydroxymethylbilane synthase [Bacillus solimangrovi]|uniref:Porphobilinogen deaminase n=1 Tax=Bacillus solimangrovi TaxID=1305675 RepID=A0A1E5LBH6_9BACI|nr:hydroxymethylbilane synthase [Bacillus solimangrovi]OEH91436.1 hydroxymethylbilane synthase [Bacillus solimangrovi]
MRKIIVGSRKSMLALTQTNWFINKMKDAGLPFEFEVKEIVTKGDQILNVTLSKVGGKGLFVKEIEQALLNKEIDMAVHSMKDMPSILPEGFVIGCVPGREDYRDAFISKGHVKLADLPSGAVVGTSSLRRSAQILAQRPDLEIKWIRGNIDTRLSKLDTGDYDAIILAAAGLARMNWSNDVVTEYLDQDICVPAVGQGALAIECREDDTELLDALQILSDERVERTVTAERAFLNQMEGSCQVPVAGLAEIMDNDEIKLMALVSTPDGKTILREELFGTDPVRLGEEAAKILKERGAQKILDEIKAELDR